MRITLVLLSTLLLFSCGNRGKLSSGGEAGSAGLEGQWVLLTLDGDMLPDGFPAPELEIRLQEKQYLGMDGCNRYFGSLALVEETELRFGLAAGTRMACPHMELSDSYLKKLDDCRYYVLGEGLLRLLDKEQAELLRFRKNPRE